MEQLTGFGEGKRMAKTISVAKGKGNIRHNNRDFISDNIDKTRIKDNIIYVQQPLEQAYQEIFGQAVQEYNNKQKRADRKITDYMEHLKTSKNREKLFYDVVVQVGDKDDSGYGTKDFKLCGEVLDSYMKDFQQRNPNLHVFNAVLHLDEATPHLHITFIPVAKGYKTGLSVRNSLSKSMEGFATGEKTRMKNGILGWYAHEREVLKEYAQNRGIEITELGVDRKRLSIPEYKEVKEEIKALESAKNTLKNEIREEETVKYTVESEIKALQEDLKAVKTFDNHYTPKAVLGRISEREYKDLKDTALKLLGDNSSLQRKLESVNKDLALFQRRSEWDRKKADELKQENAKLRILNEELEGKVNLYEMFINVMNLEEKLESSKALLKSTLKILSKPFEFTLEQYKAIESKLNKKFDVTLGFDKEDMAKFKKSPSLTKTTVNQEWDLDR